MNTNEYVPPCARAALDYIDKGLAVIPLKVRDKVPATQHGSADYSDNPEQVQVWWGFGKYKGFETSDPDYNVGIVCGKASYGLIVIDLDVHGTANGLETLRNWEVEHGELPETWTQITGSGGKQMFYRTSRDIRNSAGGALGVDVRGEGGYVVAPPSFHPCGDYYEWSVSPDDCELAQADDRVYSFIDYVRPSHNDGEHHERFVLDDVIAVNRNDTLFRYASSLRSRGCNSMEINSLLHTVNSARVQPPLDERELMKIIGSVCRYEPGNKYSQPVEDATPMSTAGEGEVEKTGISIFDRPDEPASRIKDETVDAIKNILLNLDEVREYIKFNKFDSRLHVLGRCIPDVQFERPHVMEQSESVNLRAVLERDYGVRNKQKFEDALVGFGGVDGQRYNPMHDLLDTLPIVEYKDEKTAGCTGTPIRISEDGGKTWRESTAVVGTLTYEMLEVEPTGYSMEVEKLMFRQLVARAMCPGCKADQMFVFVGKQGTGKSTFVKLLSLSPDFFVEGFSNFDNEDLKRISGRLVVEIPELDGFNGKDKNKIKSMITQTTDIYRESYARTPVEHPRTAVFFGTTNDGAFLNDSTGGRRFMLVESKKPMLAADPRLFNGEGEGMIRQAWAETLALYKLWGEGKFLRSLTLPPEILREATEHQQKFSEEVPLITATNNYLDELKTKGITRVNVRMVFIDGLGYSDYQFTNTKRFMQQQVTMALDNNPEWKRLERARVAGYGISRAWELCDPTL